ncbi:MAG TPA: OsmC family protein [Firmicutes bacterium]|nr:OsmC family protein [Bacillota bacterium]
MAEITNKPGTIVVNVEWNPREGFSASNESAAVIKIGGSPGIAETEPQFRPMQLLLAALGGCTGIDAVSIMEKQRINIEAIKIRITGERAQEHPKVFTNINLHFDITAKGGSPEQVRRALQLSRDKYCSVGNTISKVANLVYSFSLNGQEFSL